MNTDAKTEADVMDVMKKWPKAYEARDIKTLMSLFGLDSSLGLIGTGGMKNT